ncbi:uncharacterized protein MONBRDRAFT_15993 [Monosiga brevicollis MX1]|uniref:Eukaryotic translation initiation factor 3 subunit K n=1 Tax=Monosiga brevicollis TaxID=81824 RepID=A9UW43_MONBE|nr:uncharacterized protein MONBRDRAFT_15993 [Monosiga brevicollis MX1]EDQ90703.1 predicted protein [Monosiga brevicollis MX1]|eukprot:XP_001744754.1 hypothetical protein [Monosiga brevicollis MX1]
MSEELRELEERFGGIIGTIERYNPSNLGFFAEYFEKTLEENYYDLDVCLAILKLYQFNPTYFNLPTACTVLLKALTGMPDNDFFLCASLLTVESQQQRPIQQLMYLHQLLESCRFAEFWVRCGRPAITRPLFVTVVGFVETIREYAAYIIQSTYQHVSVDVVREMTNIKDAAALEEFAKSHEWTKEGDNYMVSRKDDVVVSKTVVEKIEFGGELLLPIILSFCVT